ncbi:MAG: hypothetical protein GTO45_17135 [Candidatus Aminicenantes bacterium]|nr:hypothetical protein [Candidatus Aminicenantes bacterium]NIM80463.1 hypothetical protein [Candidatus Aminicenantes bacterium]NIN19856.1 hypothetical protein [Candidatus Aminicenantes bacterium]NIN43732.1 hypothetical protein [Candidatus Aminicenantes bacterium]NIN86482.1 hypothetical protein [Candidatus Aminicenantes bacterium]
MKNKYKEKCIGVLLGTAVGDILGASVEGYPREAIRNAYGEVRDFWDSGRGFGRYTDDTEMALALAQSLVECNGVDGEHCAQAYANYYNPWRGYGGGAHVVIQALKQGADYRETGTIQFRDGSFGNGGAMRIAPVGVVYHNKTDEELKTVVFEAIRCTHVHPEGIDGAVAQAKGTALLTSLEHPADFTPKAFLEAILEICSTEIMIKKIRYLQTVLGEDVLDDTVIRHVGCGIRASEAVSCALWAAIKYYNDPEEAVIKSVNFGGDTDTIGAMTGALMGTLHGKDWIPKRWLDNMENRTYGRDYMIKLGTELSGVTL